MKILPSLPNLIYLNLSFVNEIFTITNSQNNLKTLIFNNCEISSIKSILPFLPNLEKVTETREISYNFLFSWCYRVVT